MSRRRLVVVRPEPGASATIARARALGIVVVALPLFAVEPTAWAPPAPDFFDALLLTSANALRHGGPGLRALIALPVLAVGTATADAARAAGFTIERTGMGGVADLLADTPAARTLLHLSGRDRVDVAARQSIDTLVVYESRAVSPPDASLLEGAVVALHSPRAARQLAAIVSSTPLDRSTIALVALRDAVASSAGDGWASVAVAPHPTDDALLALAAELCLDVDE